MLTAAKTALLDHSGYLICSCCHSAPAERKTTSPQSLLLFFYSSLHLYLVCDTVHLPVFSTEAGLHSVKASCIGTIRRPSAIAESAGRVRRIVE